MANCVCCGSIIPDNQGSKTCSMCYGDPFHGVDGFYAEWLEKEQMEQEQKQEQEQE